MLGQSWVGRIGLAVLALSLLLAGCGRAAPRTGEQAAPGGQAASEQSKTGQGKTMEVAGLKLVVPEDNVLWPTIYPKDPGQPKYGGTITTVYPGDPPTLDPSNTTSYLRSVIGGPTYDKLVEWKTQPGTDPYSIVWQPGLAESWQISDDGRTYTFKLRQGVKFPDVPPVNGREFTSADVRFTYEYFTRESSLIKSLFEKIDGMDTPDKYTVVYRLKQRDRGFLNIVGGPYGGFIVPREVVERDGDLKKVIIGTGPFYNIEGFQPKVGIDFVRNPNHWRKDEQGNQRPYVDGWKFRVIPDQAAQVAAFRTGKLDLAPSAFRTPTELKGIMRTNPTALFQEYVSGGVQVGAFRLDKAPWNDVRVRRAMNMAINRDEMAQVLFELPKAVSVTPTVRGFWAGEKDDLATLGPWFQYNPEEAKKLLAEAGFANGITANFQFFEYSKIEPAQAEMLKNYWAKVGVDVEIKSMDYTVFRSNTDRATWDDLIRTITFPTYDDVDNVLNYVYSKGLGNNNQGKLHDEQIDRWVEAFWASNNDTERMDLLKKIRRQYLDQAYGIPLAIGPSFFAWQPWVRNIQPGTNIFNVVYDATVAHAWIDDSWRK